MALIAELCQRLYDTPFATSIRESDVTFSALETIHVLSLALIVGTIAIVDLRLLGVVLKDTPAERIERSVVPVTWGGFAVMATTGGLLFVSEAAKIQSNPAFRVKLVLMGLAGINVLLFHLFLKRRLAAVGRGAPIPGPIRASAAASLALWTGVICAGRAIAYFHAPAIS
jgi:hypothetical protein